MAADVSERRQLYSRGEDVQRTYGVVEDDISRASSFGSSASTSLPFRPTPGRRMVNKLQELAGRSYLRSDKSDLVISSEPFIALPLASESLGQSSSVAIFSLWSNMVGGGLFVLPWAMAQSGVGLGIPFIFLATLLLLYTCRLIVKHMHDAGVGGAAADLSDLCRLYLGKKGETFCNLTMCVYDLWQLAFQWIVISNFAYYAMAFAIEPNLPERNGTDSFRNFSPDNCSDECLPFVGDSVFNTSADLSSAFEIAWTLDGSVPAFVACVLFPLLHFRQPHFFAKFSTMGIMSLVQIVIFVIVTAVVFSSPSCSRAAIAISSTGTGWRFPVVVAVVMFSLNVHQNVIPIMRTQRHPSRNVRDVTIAYGLAMPVYLLIGVLFVLFFPNSAGCTQQIFLDNFSYENFPAFSLRVMVAVQMLACFPLRAYILRARAMKMIFGRIYPSALPVFIFNCLATVFWIVVAQNLRQAGDVARFTGAIGGMFLMFVLPSACHLSYLKSNLALSYRYLAGHVLLLLTGLAIVLGQFFVS